jgi:RNA polymerase sigma-70 factor, ECF subfamily
MQRYETRLLAYIHRLINAPTEDAEDILQEVFIKTYENLNDFDTSLRFSSWIYRITHNHTISFYRKFKNQPSTLSTGESQTFFENLRDDTDIPNQINQKLNSKKIATLLQKLDKKYHTVLILRYLEGKDYSEISDILKKPMGTVATLLNRAKSHFKKILITNGHDG